MQRGATLGGFVAACLMLCGGLAAQVTENTTREETTRREEATTRGEETATTTYKEKSNSVTVVTTTRVERETEVKVITKKDRYKCAIFVTNRAVERIPDKKVLNMQDYFTAHATDRGFTIIAREDVINSVSKLALDGPNKGDPRLVGDKMDEMLSNNTSALRLAQMMNADYVLVLSITNYGINKQKFVDPAAGINLLGMKHQMKTTFKLLDGVGGGSMTAGVSTLTVNQRVDPGVQEEEIETVVDDLLDACAADMSRMLGRARQADVIAAPDPAAKDMASFFIHCGVADMVYPEVVKDNNTGQYTVQAGKYKLLAMGFQVHLDGILVGSTSLERPLKARPGLHKLRLSRPMFRDHESTINITDGMIIDIAMELNAEGFREFLEMTKFFNMLKKDQILTDAQAKMWEHYMEQMRHEQMAPQRRPTTGGAGTGPNEFRDEILGRDRPANRPNPN